ncbi:uncharacterized protein TRIVIDRAFT_39580 [Trichoderma virens Gv29-8]|uniref:RNA binding protein Nrd1 n=1 Tax=Hypocrea virens (strain Gv29-8 / FGSC 10586) TaxID=413071 RepID=G9NAY7_HYPVG|nr:uncharacterized protein TRIVIDRAFT_39580 [Trichoderma virens Gv29-8]EHK15997.1 hypothetical protein TRIVIDRAFT_39580 [Trichoderma virens Gv29-8]
MASAVTDLEAGLQAMLNLKPPGVSGSRITSLTSLCVANIQSESVLIQKIYTHFKKTPGTHKLGVLYVVDSVTRKWLEQAKSQGQPINSSAQDGTYAAGVHRVTELMPVLMNDILQSAPEDQKEKIKKLLDIWEKGQTFPTTMIESFKEKVNAPSPPSSPPPGLATSLQNQAQNKPAPNGSSILEALANIARQNTSAAPSNQSLPAPAASYSMPSAASNAPPASATPPGLSQALASAIPQLQPHQSYPPAAQPVNVSSLPFSLTQMLGQNAPSAMPASASNPSNPYAAASAAPPAGGAGLDPNVQQQIMLIKALADQGVPFDKIPALIQSMTAATGTGGFPASQPPAPVPAAQGTFPSAQQPWATAASGPAPDQGYQDSVRSPRYRGRSRSRSPERGWNARGSPRGGREYGRNSPPRGRMDDRDRNGRGGNDYRQRSPRGRHGRSPSPPQELQQEKWVEFDPTLPSGHIKVLSRTLFVGGVTCSETELRNIFGRYGTVQTCIVNKDKRHAFVKMLTRQDAVRAKDAMEDARGLEYPLRTRWGVGFGPRDCSDYSTGISVIPIHKLTDADRKWMLTAPYGGSGGRPIETGLCVEEPDIEIGAGVSSKAISRRMQTDKGGSNGPKSTRHRDDDSRWRRGRDDGPGQMELETQQQNSMAGFPFGIGTLPNGMPNFPTGFRFPDPNTAGRT